MAVTEGKLPVGTTGENLDTTKVTQTDGTEAHREAVVITDPEVLGARTKVAQEADIRDYGVQVWNAGDYETRDLLRSMLIEMRITNMHLSMLTETKLTNEDVDDDTY